MPTRSSCRSNLIVWPLEYQSPSTELESPSRSPTRPSWIRPGPGRAQAPEAFAERVLDRERSSSRSRSSARCGTRHRTGQGQLAANAEQLRRQVANRERLVSTLDQAKALAPDQRRAEQPGAGGRPRPDLQRPARARHETRSASAVQLLFMARCPIPVDLQMLAIERRAQRRSGAQARLEEMGAPPSVSLCPPSTSSPRARGDRAVSSSPRPPPRSAAVCPRQSPNLSREQPAATASTQSHAQPARRVSALRTDDHGPLRPDLASTSTWARSAPEAPRAATSSVRCSCLPHRGRRTVQLGTGDSRAISLPP